MRTFLPRVALLGALLTLAVGVLVYEPGTHSHVVLHPTSASQLLFVGYSEQAAIQVGHLLFREPPYGTR